MLSLWYSNACARCWLYENITIIKVQDMQVESQQYSITLLRIRGQHKDSHISKKPVCYKHISISIFLQRIRLDKETEDIWSFRRKLGKKSLRSYFIEIKIWAHQTIFPV